MPLDVVETLQRLIRTPSVNPMGGDASGPEFGEGRMTDLLVGICESQGWAYRRQAVYPGRDNLLVLFRGNPSPVEGGELLVWDVHQDTVSVEGMTVEPFGGVVRDGRVYGRGASDVKGTMAAMLAALSRAGMGGPGRRPTIVLACTVNEECGFTGAKELVKLWSGARSGDAFFPRRPDAAIVGEPTGFDVIVAHQGQVRWRCHTIGRAAHTSRPDKGLNAIYAMARVVQTLEQYHRELSANGPLHALCGRPSLCVSTIQGGVGINTVPERATIAIDRRLAPNESPEAAYADVGKHIAANVDLGGCRIEHDPPFMQSCGLSDENSATIAERLVEVAGRHGRKVKRCGAPYGTDAAAIGAAGVPTVVFGPGSIDQAHTADEFIEVAELEVGVEMFFEIARGGVRP